MRYFLITLILAPAAYVLCATVNVVDTEALRIKGKHGERNPVEDDGSTFRNDAAREYEKRVLNPPPWAAWSKHLSATVALLFVATTSGAIGGFLGAVLRWVTPRPAKKPAIQEHPNRVFRDMALGAVCSLIVIAFMFLIPSVLARGLPVPWIGENVAIFCALVSLFPDRLIKWVNEKIANLIEKV